MRDPIEDEDEDYGKPDQRKCWVQPLETLEAELTAQPQIAETDGDAPPPPENATEPIKVPMSLEQRCTHLEQQLKVLHEATRLRKRLLEIRETQTTSLSGKLKILHEAIDEERRSRQELMKRFEAAELECSTVKDKLRRNLEALERMKGHHERRVTMLSANLEIAEIKAQGNNRKLEEARRKNAEQKGLLEQLTMKLNENRKVTKGLEKKLKREGEKNGVLRSQVTLINGILEEAEAEGKKERSQGQGSKEQGESQQGANATSPSSSAGSLLRIKKLLRHSEEVEATKAEAEESNEEDEGVELSNLMDLEDDEENEDEKNIEKDIPGEESCYKRVDTSEGPQLILSVSRTFIKLKDLILEKRSLQQTIDNYKNLNARLEGRVDKQERRLYCVTKELNKTWSLVSKLKLQQDKLHNNEAFLRFELKENRATVERLKKEMQSYKEKWKEVREKNDESQNVWQALKDEFAQRKEESKALKAAKDESHTAKDSLSDSDDNSAAEPVDEAVVDVNDETGGKMVEDDLSNSHIDAGVEVDVGVNVNDKTGLSNEVMEDKSQAGTSQDFLSDIKGSSKGSVDVEKNDVKKKENSPEHLDPDPSLGNGKPLGK